MDTDTVLRLSHHHHHLHTTMLTEWANTTIRMARHLQVLTVPHLHSPILLVCIHTLLDHRGHQDLILQDHIPLLLIILCYITLPLTQQMGTGQKCHQDHHKLSRCSSIC